MKNERTVYTTRGCFPFIRFSSCNRKNENGYNWSYFYFSFFVWSLEKRKRMLSYPFSILYYEIEKRKTKGRYIHGPIYHLKKHMYFIVMWLFSGVGVITIRVMYHCKTVIILIVIPSGQLRQIDCAQENQANVQSVFFTTMSRQLMRWTWLWWQSQR